MWTYGLFDFSARSVDVQSAPLRKTDLLLRGHAPSTRTIIRQRAAVSDLQLLVWTRLLSRHDGAEISGGPPDNKCTNSRDGQYPAENKQDAKDSAMEHEYPTAGSSETTFGLGIAER